MRSLDERSRQRDALLLAARELAWTPVNEGVDAHEPGDLAGPVLRLGPFDLLES